MLSKFFINRPIFASVIAIVIVIAGIIALRVLPMQEYPALTPPQISIQATYPGADALTLSKTVAAPLEDALNGVDKMLYMSSTLSPSGILNMSVVFEPSTNSAMANVDVNNRVQTALSKLPQEVREQGISIKERSPDMLRVIGITSHNQKHDALWLNNYALINILDDIKRIDGVGEARLFGSKEYSMRLWIDPDKLHQYNVTINEVLNAVKEQNAQIAAGQMGADPVEVSTPYNYTLTTTGRLKTTKEFENIIISSNSQTQTLYLKDVAQIEMGASRYILQGKFNDENMAVMGVFLAPGANALEVASKLDKTLKTVAKNFPDDIRIHTLNDTTRFVRVSIQEVIKTLLEAIVLVVLIIYLFLGNVRATFIPLLAIPVSIFGTFAGLYLAGFSINILTLFAMVLAIGLVVDDAIVVIENIERLLHSEKSLSVKEATKKAMNEITGPVIAIVLVLSAVFIPASLMPGLSGMMYQQFAMTIVIAVTISGFVALTLTPALAAIFLQREEPRPIAIVRYFNQLFDFLTHKFSQGVALILRKTLFFVLIFLALIGVAYGLLNALSKGLVPNEDKGQLMVMTNLMPASSLQRTQEVQLDVAKTALAHKDVHHIGTMTGIDRMTFAFKSDAGVGFIHLNDWSKRPNKDQSSFAIAQDLRKKLGNHKEASIMIGNPPPIRGLSVTGGFGLYVQDRTGGSIEALDEAVNAFVKAANAHEKITGVKTKLNTKVPQYHIEVDTLKAKALGVSPDEVLRAIGSSFGTRYVNDFNIYGRTFAVNIQALSHLRDDANDLNAIFVRNKKGALVSVRSLATLKRTTGPSVIERFNMFNAAQISGRPAPGYSSIDAMDALETIAQKVLPQGYTLAWYGTSYQEQEVRKQSNLAIYFALAFVFLILAALYESWSIPFAVLMTVPFALFGAALGVFLRGLDNDIYFQVGIITLIGLAAKNAILIVEFAQQRIAKGLTLYEATMQASRIRFRPIVMTSLAFIGGTLPLALSSGAGANSRHIIGTTVVSGTLALTILAVFFIPLFYYLIMKAKNFMSKKDSHDTHR